MDVGIRQGWEWVVVAGEDDDVVAGLKPAEHFVERLASDDEPFVLAVGSEVSCFVGQVPGQAAGVAADGSVFVAGGDQGGVHRRRRGTEGLRSGRCG